MGGVFFFDEYLLVSHVARCQMALVQFLCHGCLLRRVSHRADLRAAVGGVDILCRPFNNHGSSRDVEFDRGVDSEVTDSIVLAVGYLDGLVAISLVRYSELLVFKFLFVPKLSHLHRVGGEVVKTPEGESWSSEDRNYNRIVLRHLGEQLILPRSKCRRKCR